VSIQAHVLTHPLVYGWQIADAPTDNKQLIRTLREEMMWQCYEKWEGRKRTHPIHGKQLADSAVRRVHMMLHEAMETALRERLIAKNPTNGTTVPKNNYLEKQILDDRQLEIFMETIKTEPDWYDFFYTELMTGMRRGEICGLKWSDFDPVGGTLKIRRSVGQKKGGGVQIGETKTDTGERTIILPPSVTNLLTERKKNALTEWIFPNLYKPEEPMNPASAYNKLKVILRHAELPMLRFHDLRHTFSTHALANGVDAKTLSGILGHTNASFTLDTYTHVTGDMQKNASVIVGSMIKGLLIKDGD
jgi:integrase